MAKQSEKFESIVKHLQKLNEAESVVKQKLAPSGKLTTPAIQVQSKMDPEVEGAGLGIEGHGVKDKSEEYLKKSEEYLKNIDKTLKNIQDSFAKNNSASGKSDSEPGKSGSTGKLPDLPKDYTLTEGLKSTVGMAKSIGKGIAGFASNPKKTLSNAFGSVKDSVKGALGTAKDILGAEAGYTPERERFAKGYAASAKGTQFQKGGKSALDAGKDKYDALKTKEDEINKVKEKMDVPASQGFSPLKKDQKELDNLNKEFDALDPRVTAASPAVDKSPEADAISTPKIDKSPNEKITATSVNPESDNIETSGELISKEIRETNDLIGQNLSIVKLQLEELKGIRLALTPAVADDPSKDPSKRVVEKLDELIEAVKEGGGGGGGGGGLGLTDLIPSGGKAAAGGKLASRMASLGKAAKIGGAVLAVGAGAYTAYKGYTEAEDNKQAKMDEVQAKVDSGEMKPEEAAAARKEIGNTATVEKSGAIGEGTGMAAGAIAGGLAGAKLGGTIGTFIGGPLGTAVGAGIGGIAGGALGAFAGSSAGKYVGEKAGEGINYLKDKAGGIGSAVSGFFGGKKEEAAAAAPGAATKEALAATAPTAEDNLESLQAKRDKLAKQGPATDSPQSTMAHKNVLSSLDKAIEEKKSKPREEQVTGGPGAKDPVTVGAAGAAVLPIVEKKPVDTAAPGKATAVAPIETVDGKKVKPGKDVDKVQQAAKEKYQASTSEETAASEKLKEFEKANPFDFREKPTATQDFLEEPGTGKFKDPNKQKEYDDILKAKEKASESKRSAGAAYTAAEGVTKTYEFTGGEQPSKPGDKGGIQGQIDKKIGGMQSDGAKIEALKKRGYTDKDLGRDDTLKQNYIGMSDGAKYPNRNLGKYEDVVKKELEAPSKDSLTTAPLSNNIAAGVSTAVGATVVKASTENADLNRETSRGSTNVTPIVSNNSSTNNNTSYVPVKPTPRNERGGSALDRYQDRVSAF